VSVPKIRGEHYQYVVLMLHHCWLVFLDHLRVMNKSIYGLRDCRLCVCSLPLTSFKECLTGEPVADAIAGSWLAGAPATKVIKNSTMADCGEGTTATPYVGGYSTAKLHQTRVKRPFPATLSMPVTGDR